MRAAALMALLVSCGPDLPLNDAGIDLGGDDMMSTDDFALDLGGPFVGDGGTAMIIPGATDRFFMTGIILTPDTVIDGELLVEGTLITCVGVSGACSGMPGASGATRIDTHGIIAPGLIDTHNHILFDIFNDDDWVPSQVYMNHDQWTSEPRYGAMLDIKQCLANDSQGKPAWCANLPYGTPAGSLRCEMDKFGELKALVAGTTSVVGLPGTSSGCFGSLTRSIDVSQNGLGTDRVQTSAIFPPSATSANAVCTNAAAGTTEAYLIHVGEGVDMRSLMEFTRLSSITTPAGCLMAPFTTITHGVAFTTTEFTTMATAGVKLTWSPKSNVALYNATADIPAARAAGVLIAIAPDWSMGGSVNMLDELRFADGWDNAHWSNTLAAKDLVVMATSNASQVVAQQARLGRIQVGYTADLAVFSGDITRPYDALVASSPREVALTMVGGVPLYGDGALVAAGPAAPGCEMIDVCGAPKFICVATTSTANKFDQTLAQIQAALDQALSDADAQTPGDGWNFAPLAPLVKCP